MKKNPVKKYNLSLCRISLSRWQHSATDGKYIRVESDCVFAGCRK